MPQKIKVILDTNVFVSACLNRSGPSNRIIDALKNTELLKLVLSPEVVEEYIRVSNYKRIINKYPHFSFSAFDLIEKLSTMALFCEPEKHFDILKDVNDNKFLDLAYESKAKYLITGNHKDFTFTRFEETTILNPQEFCELYEQNIL